MAQRVTILLEDDLDGSEATQTVTFGLDGATYEIDLSDKNAETLRAAVGTYVAAGRKVGGASRRQRRTTAAIDGPSASEVRAWAQANGHTVPERGRIPSAVREAYDTAH